MSTQSENELLEEQYQAAYIAAAEKARRLARAHSHDPKKQRMYMKQADAFDRRAARWGRSKVDDGHNN